MFKVFYPGGKCPPFCKGKHLGWISVAELGTGALSATGSPLHIDTWPCVRLLIETDAGYGQVGPGVTFARRKPKSKAGFC